MDTTGAAVTDVEGDLDLAVSRLNDPALLYRNTATQPHVGVRLQGAAPNTQVIGATLRLTGGPVPKTRQMEAGALYSQGALYPQDARSRLYTKDGDPLQHEVAVVHPALQGGTRDESR